MKQELVNLRKAFCDLYRAWDQEIDLGLLKANKYYPFDQSFDEVCLKVFYWIENVENELEDKQ